MNKETLHLVDTLLEHVRSELLSRLNFGAEVVDEIQIDISGETDIEEKIHEHLQPAVEALGIALRIAEFARVNPDDFLFEEMLYFTDEDGDVRMTCLGDLKRAWRPLPPGPAYKLEPLPPEEVELPDLIGGGKGEIQ